MEVTIEITQFCPEGCEYCSSDASSEGEHLSIERIREFLSTIDVEISHINISGGEPLAHPNFYEILQFCYGITDNVWVYSNAIRKLIYNSDVVKEIELHANVCLIPGKDCYIPKNAHKVHLLQLVAQGRAKDMIPQDISLSGNLCEKCPCEHIYLRADGVVVGAPCKKR